MFLVAELNLQPKYSNWQLKTGTSEFRDGVVTEPGALSLGYGPHAPQEVQVHVESHKPQKDHMGNCETQKRVQKSMKSVGFHSFTAALPEQKKFGIYSRHKRVNRTADPHYAPNSHRLCS